MKSHSIVQTKFSLDERRKTIRKFRKQLKFSQGEFAALAGIGPSMLSRFELGNRDLSPEAFARVENALYKAMAQKTTAIQGAGKMASAQNLFSNLSRLTRPATEEEIGAEAQYIRDKYGSHKTFNTIVEFCIQLAGQEKQIAALEQQIAALREQNTSLRAWLDQEQKAALEHAKAKELEEKALKS